MSWVRAGFTPVVAIFIGSSMLLPASHAQDEGFSLEEVVVTARKREESLQATPVAVSGPLFVRATV